MNTEPGAPGAGRNATLALRRFRNWRSIRDFVESEARRAGAEAAPLFVFTPDASSAWVLRRTLERRLAGSRVSLPRIGPPMVWFRDLVGDLGTALREAPALVREVLLDESLAAADRHPGAPATSRGRTGDQLGAALLRFLDEQAADRPLDGRASAFSGFAARIRRRLADEVETDEGAARLLRLCGWLEEVADQLAASLAVTDRADPDTIRRRLFAEAEALRARLANTRALAVGEDALRPADQVLLLRLLSEDALHWALPETAPDPVTPPGISVAAGPSEEPPRSRPVRAQPSLFSVPAPAPRPQIFTPPGARPAAGAPFLFRATDRGQEARLAARLVAGQGERARSRRRPFPRSAIAAARPELYLAPLEAALDAKGLDLATRQRPSLASHPFAAAVAAVLDFAARPERVSSGLRMLRSPFFSDPELAEPGRSADVAERVLAGLGARDSHPDSGLRDLADRLRGRAVARRRKAVDAPRRERLRRRADDDALAAAVIERLLTHAGTLAPLRDPSAPLASALGTLARFVGRALAPDPEDGGGADAVADVLAQATAAAPAGAPAGGADTFGARVRRLLARRRLPRRISPRSPSPGSPPGSRRPGVELVAARDAPFGDYDGLVLLGLSDADWPGPRPGNIFFPHRLLEPATRERHTRRRPAEIRLLRDLPSLPRQFLAVARPELDDSFPVGTSPFEAELEEVVRGAALAELRTTPDAPTAAVAPLPTVLDRQATSARVLDQPLSPTALGEAIANPAQFLAKRVLDLDEEDRLRDVPDPRERGNRLHDFLERGFGALAREDIVVSEANLGSVLDRLRAAFPPFAEKDGLSAVEAAAEEAWLFGGELTPGALEWFLRELAARPARPAAMEEQTSGELRPAASGAPALRAVGRFDRLDALPDGSFRILEFKSGRLGSRERPIQAVLYARLVAAARGAPTESVYVYFGDRQWVGADRKPRDPEIEARLDDIHPRLAAGDFSLGEEGRFDFALVVRSDLPDAGPPPVLPVGASRSAPASSSAP